MNHPTTRAIDLEFPLITQIRKEGSQKLINALQDCQIRVEICGRCTYAVMTFPNQYSSQVIGDLMDEVGRIGYPLGIFPCDGELENPTTTTTVVVDPYFPNCPREAFERSVRRIEQRIKQEEGSHEKKAEAADLDLGGEVDA